MNELKRLNKEFSNMPALFGGSFFPSYDKLFQNFFGDWGSEMNLASFKTDVQETDKEYLLEAELPGFNKEDIKVELNGDYLTIKAEHSNETKDEEKGKYIKQERYFGSYSRSFDVSGIDTDEIKASYKDGILKLNFPKKEIDPKKDNKLIEIQ